MFICVDGVEAEKKEQTTHRRTCRYIYVSMCACVRAYVGVLVCV